MTKTLEEKEYDIRAVARLLKTSEQTIRRLITNRELGHFRKGSGRGRIFVLESQLEAYREARIIPARST